MGERVRVTGRQASVLLVVAVLTAGIWSGVASAGGETPTASAAATCVDDEGFIEVAIVDDFSTTYDVYIDDVLVDAAVTDSDGGVYAYGPYDNGDHNVRVYWIDGTQDILDQDVNVDCAPEPTTTTTTVSSSTTTAAAAPVTTAQPAFTG